MARVHKCAHIDPDGTACPELAPCAKHSRPANAPWSSGRDGAAHDRWQRAAKKAQPWCSHCGRTTKLDAHHGPNGEAIVLCNDCHVLEDPHARTR